MKQFIMLFNIITFKSFSSFLYEDIFLYFFAPFAEKHRGNKSLKKTETDVKFYNTLNVANKKIYLPFKESIRNHNN